MRRDVRWNFGAALIDAAGWGLGMSFLADTTLLPAFVGHLTPSPLAVGLIQATKLFGWLVPGIFVAGYIGRLPRVKASVLWIAALERAMLLLMAALAFGLGARRPELLLVGFFACWSIMNAAMGANSPGYYQLIAKTIPAEARGRLYGLAGALSGLAGAPAAAFLTGHLLAREGFPTGYAACFLAAFLVQTLTVLPLAWIREPVGPAEAATEPLTLRVTLGLLREPRLAWLCAAVALVSVNQMAGAFYADYARHRFGADDRLFADFTAAVMGARVVALLLVGWVGDRFGNRRALQLSTAAGALAAALALVAPSAAWLAPVFVLNEAALQGWGICSVNYVLELCPPQRSGAYTAVFGLATGPFRVGLPLVGGWLVGAAGHGVLFAAAVAGGVATLALLGARVPEPRTSVVSGAAEIPSPGDEPRNTAPEEAAGRGGPSHVPTR